jgi:hypothetical protein
MKKTILFPALQLLLCLTCTVTMAQEPTLEWAKNYDDMNSQFDIAVSVAVDAEGNSYVTGTSYTPQIIATIEYSPAGEQL